MYESPGRCRGVKRCVGVSARQESAELHRGTRWDCLRRHRREADRAVREGGQARQKLLARLLDRTADPRNLRCALDYLDANGGHAPGVDGLTFEELDERDRWELVRTVSVAILDDT